MIMKSKQSESKRKNFKCQNGISCILEHLKIKLTCTDCIAIIITVLFLCYAICSTLEILHKFINNYDINRTERGTNSANFWDKIRNYWDNCPSS